MNCRPIVDICETNMDITCDTQKTVFFRRKMYKNHPKISEFLPSRKKLKSSKNPWHHPLALGPSIDLPSSYIVSKFGVIPSSRSRDITNFCTWTRSGEKIPFFAIFGWLILHERRSATLSESAVGCSFAHDRVPRNPWKLPLVDTPHTDTLRTAVGNALCTCRVARNPWKLLRPSEDCISSQPSDLQPVQSTPARPLDIQVPAYSPRSPGFCIMNCINL